ncbi:MAG: GvpL/GvpF family gas vesicle protein [Dehalococcoidia bacterium]|nr:GvpL/GvpF family gas vesicle protein [Dehalococcoidia bacterium]
MGQKYIYGVVRADRDADLEAPGIGGSPVHILTQQGLGCVLSDYSGQEFATLSKEEAIRCLLAHQAVVEKVMEAHSVLPVKFGTIVPGEPEARAFLSQGSRILPDILMRLQDKIEVEVAATWDTSQVLRELASHLEEIVRAKAAITALPPGEAVRLQIRLGQIMKEALDQRRADYRDRMLAFLKPLAQDVQSNVLVSDQMVMNVAFLVQKSRQSEFDSYVNQLNDLFHDQINFRVIGPLPPYSFATVEITRPHWERLEEARKLLRLSEHISEPQVRSAYRHMAAENHPDINTGDGAAKVGYLVRLREASEMLLAYCRGQAVPSEAKRSYPITAEAVKQAILINVKRPAGENMEQPHAGGISGKRTWEWGYGAVS